MQGTISCRRNNLPAGKSLLPWAPSPARESRDGTDGGQGEEVRRLVAENAVVVIGRRGCCLCHVVKMLLLGLGVNPTVFDVDEEREDEVIGELARIAVGGGNGGGLGEITLPAVYVGGKLFGGLDRVMATHISGELVPILKEVGALWL